jgi:predicted RNA-binding Zn ribbon-like protein
MLVLANNRAPLESGSLAVVNRAAARLSLQLSSDGVPTVSTDGDALDRIVGIVLEAMLAGSWGRLKACRNCSWSFYDYSPNRSATWCSMQLCGNRTKTRAYRARRRT